MNSALLAVSDAGVVSTESGGISTAGTHTIIVSAESSDYIGAARLELILDLAAEGELLSGDTISLEARTRLRPVAPGYAGSVAFFAAGRAGVTLRTPSNPAGFNFGTGGENKDYESPDGFTLYLNADAGVDAAGDTATASFAVTAKDSGGGFADDTIDVAVTVSALAAPAQAPLVADAESNFDHGLVLTGVPGGLDGDNGALNIVGVEKDRAADTANAFRLEGKNLRPTAAGGAPFGDYRVSIGWTHPKFLGELTLVVEAAIAEVIVADDIVAAEGRNATVTVATGYYGDDGYKVPLVSSYAFQTVLFDAAKGGYDQERHVIQILGSKAPTTESLELAVTATAVCADENRNCAARAVTVSVTFVPLQPFAQNALSAVYDEDFRHGVKTGVYQMVDMSVTGVGGGDDSLFDVSLENDDSWSVVRSGGTFPLAGGYTIFLDMTHPDFLGALPLEVTATIRPADLNEGAYGLPQPAGVTVASGYTGYLYTDISLRALAAEGVLATPLGAFPAGVSLSLLRDSRGVAPHLTLALDGEEFRPQVTLTVSRGANYNSLEQIATLSVTALRAPPLAEASGEIFGGTPSFNGNVFNLADAGYESGAYAGARFEEKAESFGLQVDADGRVFTKADLGAGDYLLTVVAHGRPDSGADAGVFVGNAEITVSLRISQGSEDITADDVVRPAARHVTLDAAAGYFGRGYKIPVRANYTLSAEKYDSTELGYDDVNKVISILADKPVPASGELTLTLSGDGGCSDGIRSCPVMPVSITAVFRAIAAIGQNGAAADYLEGFTVDLKFPVGYESVSGRDTEILYPLPREGDIAADQNVCEALGGKYWLNPARCAGYSASLEHRQGGDSAGGPVETRGVCTFRTEPWFHAAYYPCVAAFTSARDCNAANKAAKNNSKCAADACGKGEFALGGKCLALKLNDDGDKLEHAPTGADDALNAGVRRLIAVGMTHSGLLGTVRMEVPAVIGPRLLDAGLFSLSAPYPAATVTVAAGEGAVGAELARVSLIASDSAFGAFVRDVDASAFPANLSLEFLPLLEREKRTVVFYLSRALDGGGAEDRTAALVIDSSNLNYLPLARHVTLRITVLQNPTLAAAVGTISAGAPYGNNALHNFKTGDYAAATNFERDAANSDSELEVNANTGVVSTSGDIARAGTYNLVVSVTSPDFAGKARLELQLTLEAENALPAKDTIPGDARGRTIFVAPGYSGSVAFFAANKGGVALRLPPSAPAGFGFGGNGLNAEFESPDGFTLFLNAGQIAAGAARAVFAVTARASGFIDTRIWVTVSVAAVAPPSQPTLTALHQDALYGAVAAPADYPLENPAIAGAAVYAFGGDLVPLGDWANRVKIENGRLLPFGAGDDSRLTAGIYQITVRTTHSGFLGGLSLTVPVNVQDVFDADDVLSAEARNATVTVATGYSGPGYKIPLSVGYVFQTVLSDGSYDAYRNIIEIPESAPIGGENLKLAVTAAATCVAWRNCAPGAQTLTVSVTFVPLQPFAQNTLSAVYGEEFAAHAVKTGGYDGATLVISGIEGGGDVFVLDGNGGIVRNDRNTPPAGVHTISLEMTHGGFLGNLLVEVTANIRPADLDEGAYGLPQPAGVTVASGYTGYLHTDISLRAAEGVLATPLGAFPAGVSLSLLSDSRGVAPHLTMALDEEEFRPQVTLTVSRGTNYNLLEQIATLSVTALRAPPLAAASGETFGGTPSFVGNVFNLAGAEYEGGAYAGAHFSEKSPSSSLGAAPNGQVSTRGRLGAGDYLLTIVARGRPDSRADADAFIGEAEITVSLRISQGSEDITADDVVRPAARHVTLDAAAGYFGRGYKIPVRANYALSAEKYDSTELGYDDVNKVISILADKPVPASGELTLALSGDGGCSDGIRSCPVVPVSITAVFRAIAAIGQSGAAADYLEGFTVALNLPSDYASSNGKSGRVLSLIVSDELSNVSLSVDAENDELEYAPNGVEVDALPVGAHTVTVALTETNLLGTVFMEFAATISRSELGAAFALAGGLSGARTVAANVPFDSALVYEDRAEAEEGVVALPSELPSGFLAELSPDLRTVFVKWTTTGLDYDEVASATLSLAINHRDPDLARNYNAPRAQDLVVSIFALGRAPIPEIAAVTSAAHSDAGVYDFSSQQYEEGFYAGANFRESPDSPYFEVSSSGVVGTQTPLSAGEYGVTLLADQSPAYLGAARLTVSLTVVRPFQATFAAQGVFIGSTVTIAAVFDESSESDATGVEMEYYGTAGGLRVMFSRGDSAGALLDTGAIFAERLCAGAGGAEWRNPTLTELAMLLTRPNQESIVVRPTDAGWKAPGHAGAATLTVIFPAATDAGGGLARAIQGSDSSFTFPARNGVDIDFSAFSGLVNDNGSGMSFLMVNDYETAGLEVFRGIAICVSQTDEYDAAPHHQLAGIRLESGGDVVAGFAQINVSVTAPSRSAVGAAYTVTALAWTYGDAKNGFPVAVDLPNEDISVELADPADGDLFELRTTDGGEGPGVVEIVAELKRNIAADEQVEIRVKPPLGEAVVLTVHIPSDLVMVDYSAIPSDKSGGTLTAAGFPSGEAIARGAEIVFAAVPAEGHRVAGWNNANCATGAVNEAVSCSLTANDALNVTVTFAFVPPAVFYGAEFRTGDSAELADVDHALDGPARLELLGVRRQLTLMMISTTDGDDLIAAAGNDPDRFLDIRNFCSDGGDGWRLPKLSEAAGLIDPQTRDAVLLGRNSSFVFAPGMGLPQFNSVLISYGALGKGDYSGFSADDGILADFMVRSNDALRLAVAIIRREKEPPQPVVTSASANRRMICVRESGGYSAPDDPAGIRVNGMTVNSGGTLTVTLSAPVDWVEGDDYGLLTLEAWRFDDDGGTVRANDNTLSYLADSAAVNEIEKTDGFAIVGLRPDSGNSAADLSVFPPTGRTITVKVRFVRLAAQRAISYSHLPQDGGGGTLTASVETGGTAAEGTEVDFTATPAAGYYVSGWEGDGGLCGLGGEAASGPTDGVISCGIPVGAEDLTVRAVFAPAFATVNFSQPENGVLSARRTDTLADIVSGGIAPNLVSVEFSADPDSGWYVAEWTGDCQASGATVAEEDAEAEDGVAKLCILPVDTLANVSITVGAVFARVRAP